jgi:hypothetical protein
VIIFPDFRTREVLRISDWSFCFCLSLRRLLTVCFFGIFSSFGTLFFAGFGAGIFLDFFGADFGAIACNCSRALLMKSAVKSGDLSVIFHDPSSNSSSIKSDSESVLSYQ